MLLSIRAILINSLIIAVFSTKSVRLPIRTIALEETVPVINVREPSLTVLLLKPIKPIVIIKDSIAVLYLLLTITLI